MIPGSLPPLASRTPGATGHSSQEPMNVSEHEGTLDALDAVFNGEARKH